jgi:hypothetical protein
MAIFILILLFYIYGNQPTSMKPSDNLYLLIKSLTGNEKRYFKVFAKRHISSRQSKYEQLFDVYDSLGDDEYDESDLKKKLQKKGLGKNLADDKKNLQEMVTKSLVSFHAGQSVDSQLSDLLAADDLYRQKRLNSLRQKTIARAREIAERYDKFSVLLTLADRETTMRMEQDQESLAGIADTIGTEQKVLLHKMSTMYDLHPVQAGCQKEFCKIPGSGRAENVSSHIYFLQAGSELQYRQDILLDTRRILSAAQKYCSL